MVSMTLEDYLTVLELGYFEVGEAFGGLADEHVWVRPHEKLLSVGELAGHIAYWEAVRMAPDSDASTAEVARSTVQSPFVDERFAYYPKSLPTTPSDEHLTMTGAQVLAELKRVHQESVAALRELNPDLKDPVPFWFAGYDEYLKYSAFHIAYHTGQIYSVRHLLGEETPDN